MDKNENKKETKNEVVEAMLRAREKEMQRGTPEEEIPGLTSEEYDNMYQKIIARLKTEGLMKDDKAADDEKAEDSKVLDFVKATAEKREEASEKILEMPVENRTEETTEKMQEDLSDKKDEEKTEDISEKLAEKKSNGKKLGRHVAKVHWFQKKVVKIACVCLIAGVAVFGLSMTSEANRLLLMQTASEMFRTGDLMQIDNGDDRLISGGDEDKARKEISDQLHVEVPELLYLPDGMAYQGYQIFSEVGYAKIEYSYKDGFLYFKVSNSVTDMSQGNIEESSAEGKAENIETLSGTISFDITEMEGKEGQYAASWVYKNSSYRLWGKITQEELVKILKNISYIM